METFELKENILQYDFKMVWYNNLFILSYSYTDEWLKRNTEWKGLFKDGYRLP